MWKSLAKRKSETHDWFSISYTFTRSHPGTSIPGEVGGPNPPKICIGEVQRGKDPQIKMNMFAIYQGY